MSVSSCCLRTREGSLLRKQKRVGEGLVVRSSYLRLVFVIEEMSEVKGEPYMVSHGQEF